MYEIIGKFPALVSYNDYTDPKCPYKGCIKVLCPDILGFEATMVEDLPFDSLKQYMNESDWVRPHYAHPSDFYIPELGEGVYVEGIRGQANDLIWTGVYPGEDFQNLYDHTQKDGINQQVSAKTDRIIGTRNGTYIKLEDTDTGKLTIEVLGKNKLNPSRIGCKIEIDPANNQIKLLAQDTSGATTSFITLKQDSCTVQDSNNNKIEMTSSGTTVTDKNSNKIEMTSSGIKLTDKNSNTVEMASTSVKINGTALEVTQ